MPGTEERALNKKKKSVSLVELLFQWGKTDSKQIKQKYMPLVSRQEYAYIVVILLLYYSQDD